MESIHDFSPQAGRSLHEKDTELGYIQMHEMDLK